jgi:predicted Rossmann fold flavoprotein
VYPHGVTKKLGYDVAVIGGGPSGITAAYHAAKAGADVLLLDSRPKPGEKILLSGGGRCNILPLEVDPGEYITDSSVHSLRKILSSWPLSEVRAFLEGPVGIRLIEQKRTGKVFPASGEAADVRDRLLAAAKRAGVRFRVNARVVDVLPEQRRRVILEHGPGIVADQVVIATGGLSYPRTGSDGFGFEIARRLGHDIVEPYPALAALRGGPIEHHSLAGLSIPARLTVGEGSAAESRFGDFLFTHHGYSGPVLLNMSHLASRSALYGERCILRVSWLDRSEEEWRRLLMDGKGTLRGTLKEQLPDRLVDLLLGELGLWDATHAELKRDERERLVQSLVAYELPWERYGGYGEAEATGGGVALSEVDPGTLRSRRIGCLFFCGEVLDALGPIGGYNFLWAFVTGKLAGTGAVS